MILYSNTRYWNPQATMCVGRLLGMELLRWTAVRIPAPLHLRLRVATANPGPHIWFRCVCTSIYAAVKRVTGLFTLLLIAIGFQSSIKQARSIYLTTAMKLMESHTLHEFSEELENAHNWMHTAVCPYEAPNCTYSMGMFNRLNSPVRIACISQPYGGHIGTTSS